MDEVLDESIVKAKYVPREVPGYLKDFPVNILFFTLEVTLTTSLQLPQFLIQRNLQLYTR